MIKKTITITLIALLFCTMVIPSAVVAEEEIKSTVGNVSDITVDWTVNNEPIIPVDETRIYKINIEYSVIKGIALRNILLPLIKNKDVNVALEIVDEPTWCNANLDSTAITFIAGGGEQSKEVNLSVTLEKDALANVAGDILVTVTVEPVKGPFNILTLINGYTYNFTVTIKPAYLGEVAAEFPEGASIEISPYNETIIPIDVANLGNARTRVDFEIVNSSKSFNLTIDDEIIIDVEGKATANLIIIADHKFDEEEIKIKLTPKYAENPTEMGESINITLSVKNDGSYVEEEEGLQIDSTMMIAILLIIAFIVIAFILLKRKQ